MTQTFSVKRFPGSRTTRDLIRDHVWKDHFKDSIRLFNVCVRKEPLRMNKNLKLMSDVMDAEGSLHLKPRDVCAIEDVIHDEGSLRQKTNEISIMEDAESIDLALLLLQFFGNCEIIQEGWQCVEDIP